MNDPVISRDVIKDQARRAAEAGQPPGTCPYTKHSEFGKRWLAAYWQRELEIMAQAGEGLPCNQS